MRLDQMVKWGELHLEDDLQGSNRIGTNKRSIPLFHLLALHIPRKRTVQKAFSVVPNSLLYDLLMTPKV